MRPWSTNTSVALAHLLAEDRRPPDRLWEETIVSSRLIEYEVWTRLHARALAATHGDLARLLLARVLARVAQLALADEVLERALDPFPEPVRTLHALHLATVGYLREQGEAVTLATYDARMAGAARSMGIELFDLSD